jgi:hypothetical protein
VGSPGGSSAITARSVIAVVWLVFRKKQKQTFSTYTNIQVPRVCFSYCSCTKNEGSPWKIFFYPLCTHPYKAVSQFVTLFWIYVASITWKWQARGDVEGGVRRLSFGNMPEFFLKLVGETRNNFILDIRYAKCHYDTVWRLIFQSFVLRLWNQFSSLPASLWWLTSLLLAQRDSDAVYITINKQCAW